jgi:hypothetical protein
VIGKEADARFITVMKATGTGGWPPFAPKAIGDVSQVSGAASIDGGSILRCEADSTEMEVVFLPQFLQLIKTGSALSNVS